MMVFPFLLFFAGIVSLMAGQRRLSIIFWAIAMIATGALFHLHATDPLHLAF